MGKNRRGEREFEFCSVCKMNHNDGRQHVFFPRHKRVLSQLMCRFLSKISDVRFFLKNPNYLSVEDAKRNRFWCTVCETDVDELNSEFACSNAISHLSGSEHLAALKHFLWKHGERSDRMDKFRISEEDFLKWQERCSSMKNGKLSSRPSDIGPSYNIHTETNNLDMDSSKTDSLRRFENGVSLTPFIGDVGPSNDSSNRFATNSIHNPMNQSFEISNLCNGVMPLRCFTHENYQGPNQLGEVSLHPTGSTDRRKIGYMNCQRDREGLGCASKNTVSQMIVGNTDSVGWSSSSNTTQGVGGGHADFMALENLTCLPSIPGDPSPNVHTGALPPWLDTNKDLESSMDNNIVQPKKSRSQKRRKPERVGAAWAEKRKAELEREKLGQAVDGGDDDWLPNFGRVWQSGSRKESRREFENERRKLLKIENVSSSAPFPHLKLQENVSSSAPFPHLKLQPYISKRMRQNASGCDGASSENG